MAEPADDDHAANPPPDRGSPPSTPRWVKVAGILAVGLVLLVGVMLLVGGGPGGHGPGRHRPSGGHTQPTTGGPAGHRPPPGVTHGDQQP